MKQSMAKEAEMRMDTKDAKTVWEEARAKEKAEEDEWYT